MVLHCVEILFASVAVGLLGGRFAVAGVGMDAGSAARFWSLGELGLLMPFCPLHFLLN